MVLVESGRYLCERRTRHVYACYARLSGVQYYTKLGRKVWITTHTKLVLDARFASSGAVSSFGFPLSSRSIFQPQTRNYNFLKHATQNVAGDMLVSRSGFEPRGTESRRSTTPFHGT